MPAYACPNCGYFNREEARFCGRCGAALTPPADPPPQTSVVGRAPAPRQPAAPAGSLWRTGASAAGVAALAMFVLLFSLACPVLMISGRLSDPQTYIQALKDEDAYGQFPELFGDQADYWVNQLQSSFFLLEYFFRNIARGDWVLVAERILTPEWAQAQAEGLIEQFFDYTYGDADALKMTLSFGEVKERLGGETGYQTYTAIVAGKPECNMLEMSQWLLAPTIGLLPVCNPPKDANFFLFSAPDPAEVVPGVLAKWAETLPDETDLAAGLTEDGLAEIDNTFGSLRLAHTVAGAFIFIALLFLAVSLVSPGLRTLKGWLRGWGAAVMLSGILLALMALLSAALLIWQVGDLFDSLGGVFVNGVLELGKAVGGNITLGLATPVAVLGGAMTAAGFALFAASFFVGGGAPASRAGYH
ncbi:MAG: zinc ribbon domain-containing protein [Anaerolineae bacterium]|nr:zinc ribbon domain-containing protein [Anaerolineae bacterium]